MLGLLLYTEIGIAVMAWILLMISVYFRLIALRELKQATTRYSFLVLIRLSLWFVPLKRRVSLTSRTNHYITFSNRFLAGFFVTSAFLLVYAELLRLE